MAGTSHTFGILLSYFLLGELVPTTVHVDEHESQNQGGADSNYEESCAQSVSSPVGRSLAGQEDIASHLWKISTYSDLG